MIKVRNLHPLLKTQNLEEKIVQFCEENHIVFMALFGSFARGDHRRKSDVDILIRFDQTKGKASWI